MACGKDSCSASCEPAQHQKHMCQLMKEEFYLTNPAEFKELVQDAQYRCHNCGRTVKNAVNVCAPAAL